MFSIVNLLRTGGVILVIVFNALVKYAGCSEITSTCTASWLTPGMAQWVSMAFLIIVLVMKATSQGSVKGLVNKTVTVVPPHEAKPGVVTPAQVESHK